MYYSMLVFHSWWRWAVVLLLLLAFLRSTIAWIFNSSYKREDRLLGIFLLGSTHLQFLLGLILYFGLSPFVKTAMQHFSLAMKDPGLRFWLVEHSLMMLILVLFVHVGHIAVKKTIYDRQKHKRRALFTGLALLTVAVGIPWPGTKNARPLIRDSGQTELQMQQK